MPNNPYGPGGGAPPPPPKTKKKSHKAPDYWYRFKSYFNITAEQASKIRQASTDSGLDPVYLAALLYRAGRLDGTLHSMKTIAFNETRTRGATRPGVIDWLTGQKGFHKWEPHTSKTAGGKVRGYQQELGVKDPIMFVGKKQVKQGGINPVHKSEFLAQWSSYNDLYQFYLGRNATKAEVAGLLESGNQSKYSIIKKLVNKPGFYKGYAWKQQSQGYMASWKGIYGQSSKAPRDAIKKAILNNWDQSSFESYIRGLPQYKNSFEVQQNADQLSSTYYSIMGSPGGTKAQKGVDNFLKQAAVNQWDQVQLAAYLRDPKKNPSYMNSLEQRSLASQVAGSFGINFDELQQGTEPVPPGTNPQPKPGPKPPLGPVPVAPATPGSPLYGAEPAGGLVPTGMTNG